MTTTTDPANAEYLAGIEDVRKMLAISDPTSLEHRALRDAQLRAARAFGALRGWAFAYGCGQRQGKWFGLRALVLGLKGASQSQGWDADAAALFDHQFGYRDAQGVASAIVSHPYAPEKKFGSAQRFAAGHGLRVEFSGIKSWWVPGNSGIFVWTRDPAVDDLKFRALRAVGRLEQFIVLEEDAAGLWPRR